jgi:hypothetical protein
MSCNVRNVCQRRFEVYSLIHVTRDILFVDNQIEIHKVIYLLLNLYTIIIIY